MTACKPQKCSVGLIRGVEQTGETWDAAVAEHDALWKEFVSSHRALPHPGFIERYKFCPKCGRKL